jgi:hypothetical protein
MNDNITPDVPPGASRAITTSPTCDTRITTEVKPNRLRRLLQSALVILVVLLVVGGICEIVGVIPAYEPEVEADPDAIAPVDLAQVFEQVRLLVEEREKVWPGDGRREDQIENAVEQLLDNIRNATGRYTPTLPASFASGPVKISRQGNYSFEKRSVLIGDEFVRVGFADDCLIIARGAVEVAHGNRNVILAGHYIHVSHDGGLVSCPLAAPDRSVLFCAGHLDFSHARGTICSAPDLRAGHATRVTFLNRGSGTDSGTWTCRDVRSPNIIRPIEAKPNPLKGITLLAGHGNGFGNKIRYRIGTSGAEQELKLGETLAHPPGWKLAYCGNGAAVFSKNGELASLTVSRKR